MKITQDDKVIYVPLEAFEKIKSFTFNLSDYSKVLVGRSDESIIFSNNKYHIDIKLKEGIIDLAEITNKIDNSIEIIEHIEEYINEKIYYVLDISQIRKMFKLPSSKFIQIFENEKLIVENFFDLIKIKYGYDDKDNVSSINLETEIEIEDKALEMIQAVIINNI